MLLRHGTLVECRRLVCELMRRKCLGVLRLHPKRVHILEMMRPKSMRVEAMKMSSRRDLTSVHPAFGGW